MKTFAEFRDKGPSRVYQPAKGSPDVVVELPITRTEARRVGALQQAVLELLTRPGGVEFTWDIGGKSHEALVKLQKAIGAGWVDENISSHLRVPAEVSVDHIEDVLKTISPAAGSRWVIEELPPESRKVGSKHIIYAAMKTSVLEDSDVESSYLLKGNGWRQVLGVQFTEDGSKKFASATESLRGHRLLIMFEGKVLSAPVVMEPVLGGRVIIDFGNNYSFREHRQRLVALACTLSANKLMSPINFKEARVLKE
jgi:hypothetical protein